MGKITDITKQKRNKTRVNIFIDGEFVCGLDEVAVASARFKVGDEISAEEFKSLVEKSESNSAFERAVGYIEIAPRARKEIERYLKDKGYAEEIVAETVAKLDAYHYIDDYGYAQSFIKSKSKKYGTFRLAAELRKKGIPSEIADELLSEVDEDNILQIARKYLNSHRSADKQKLKRFLAGRGFSWDAISSAVSALAQDGAFEQNVENDEEYYD